MILILKFKINYLLVTEWFLKCLIVKLVEKWCVAVAGFIFYNEEWLVV